jgi:hypothetical protein
MEDCLITTFCPLCSFVQSANQLVEIEAERRRPTGGTQISIISPLQQQMAMAPAGITPMDASGGMGYGEPCARLCCHYESRGVLFTVAQVTTRSSDARTAGDRAEF